MKRYLAVWRQVEKCKVDVGAASAEVNRRIASMQLYWERGWKAPAVAMLADYRGGAEFCRKFFAGLDRITFACVLGALSGRGRHDRFAKIVRARDDEDELTAAMTLDRDERKELIEKLNEPMSPQDNRAKILALRLDSILADRPPLKAEDVTLEHVLPQSDSDYWSNKFPDDLVDRDEYRYLIGNMVLLGDAENEAAGNLDWETKRKIYLRAEDPCALLKDLQRYKDWDPTALRDRHQRMVNLLCDDLKIV